MQGIIFIGIQATGKSTFYLQNFANTHIRINLDMLKTRHREKTFLDTCLKTRQPFVVDNTNPTIEDRKRYIEPLKSYGFNIIGYYFQSNLLKAMKRNQKRLSKQRIPDKGIHGTYGKLILPKYKEGFDQLYYVKMDSENSFIVEDWINEIR